jgi:hypothetical protein
MTPALFTWNELGPIDGNLLVIINSPDDETDTVEALFATIERELPSAIVHVIATPIWQAWLGRRGIAAERVLIATSEEGRAVELNHFLEDPAAVRWSVAKGFRCSVGTEAHSVHNDEVKEIFEQRVLLLLGDGRFLAHTLPNPYVYVLDLTRMLERCGRPLKVQEYERRSRAIVADLHQLWRASGRPAVADGADYADVMQVLERRLGPELLTFDEAGPIPLPHEPMTSAFAGVISHLREVLSEHDRRLEVMTDLHAERSEAVEIRERLLAELSAERVEAVNLRDKIIADLHLQLEHWHRKLRRRWTERRG